MSRAKPPNFIEPRPKTDYPPSKLPKVSPLMTTISIMDYRPDPQLLALALGEPELMRLLPPPPESK